MATEPSLFHGPRNFETYLTISQLRKLRDAAPYYRGRLAAEAARLPRPHPYAPTADVWENISQLVDIDFEKKVAAQEDAYKKAAVTAGVPLELTPGTALVRYTRLAFQRRENRDESIYEFNIADVAATIIETVGIADMSAFDDVTEETFEAAYERAVGIPYTNEYYRMARLSEFVDLAGKRPAEQDAESSQAGKKRRPGEAEVEDETSEDVQDDTWEDFQYDDPEEEPEEDKESEVEEPEEDKESEVEEPKEDKEPKPCSACGTATWSTRALASSK
jgi:hypothetical protein